MNARERARARRLRAIQAAHAAWEAEVVRNLPDDGPTQLKPHDGKKTDYIEHLADVEATPDQEARLHAEIQRRTR